jgi:hypothetical protein
MNGNTLYKLGFWLGKKFRGVDRTRAKEVFGYFLLCWFVFVWVILAIENHLVESRYAKMQAQQAPDTPITESWVCDAALLGRPCTKPHDCDFWHAPVGSKECHYEKWITSERPDLHIRYVSWVKVRDE